MYKLSSVALEQAGSTGDAEGDKSSFNSIVHVALAAILCTIDRPHAKHLIKSFLKRYFLSIVGMKFGPHASSADASLYK